MTADERRVEVATEAMLAGWRIGPDPVSQTLAHAAAERDARAVVAALDAHDGDLRERLAAAVEARAKRAREIAGDSYTDHSYADGLDDAAGIVREVEL